MPKLAPLILLLGLLAGCATSSTERNFKVRLVPVEYSLYERP
jgi:hypothetical protein